MSRSIEVLLKQTAQELQTAGCPSPQLDAAVLLCHALDKPRSYLLTWPEKELDKSQFSLFFSLCFSSFGGGACRLYYWCA